MNPLFPTFGNTYNNEVCAQTIIIKVLKQNYQIADKEVKLRLYKFRDKENIVQNITISCKTVALHLHQDLQK